MTSTRGSWRSGWIETTPKKFGEACRISQAMEGGRGRNQVSGVKEWADKLNLFLNRFYSGTPPPTILPASTSHLLGPPLPAPTVLHASASHLPGPAPPPPHCMTSSSPDLRQLSSSTPLSLTVDQVGGGAKEDQGSEGCWPRWHQSQVAEGLCGRALWDGHAHVQHEHETGEGRYPVEDLLCGRCPVTPRPKEPNHFRPVALTSHLMKTKERILLRHL